MCRLVNSIAHGVVPNEKERRPEPTPLCSCCVWTPLHRLADHGEIGLGLFAGDVQAYRGLNPSRWMSRGCCPPASAPEGCEKPGLHPPQPGFFLKEPILASRIYWPSRPTPVAACTPHASAYREFPTPVCEAPAHPGLLLIYTIHPSSRALSISGEATASTPIAAKSQQSGADEANQDKDQDQCHAASLSTGVAIP